MSTSALDAGIPVLTEIIQAPLADATPKPATQPAAQAPVQAAPHAEAVDVADIDGWLNEEWNRLERKIGGRILQQVMTRLESDIEQRVRDALAEVLQTTVQTLADDIKQNLQVTLHDAIFQAVKEEVSRMQAVKS